MEESGAIPFITVAACDLAVGVTVVENCLVSTVSLSFLLLVFGFMDVPTARSGETR